jgi:hypothetical protein
LAVLTPLTAALLVSCHSTAQNSVIPVYNMGDRAQAGQLIYVAFDTQWKTELDTGVVPRIPTSRFFVVRMSILNSGNRDVVAPPLNITDDKGQKYEELSDGEGVPQWMGYVRKVKPAESLMGNIVFDARPQHYRLEVADEGQERKSIIDIPMSFAGDAPVELPEAPITPPPPLTPK